MKATARSNHAHTPNFSFIEYPVASRSIVQDVIAGLTQKPKKLHASLLYDARGAQLFELICRTPEYYPPALEASILLRHGRDMASMLSGRTLVEFGAGELVKVRLLLDAAQIPRYIPVDVAGEQLIRQGRGLAREYPEVSIDAIQADYRQLTDHQLGLADEERRAFFFPGSSIGNFDPADVEVFFRNIYGLVRPDGIAIIGIDLQKPVDRLNRAYNDRAGHTASFNLNVLKRINRELHADFRPERFEHVAFYNEGACRVEMHLRSRVQQTVSMEGYKFDFAPGETIHTENSYKYLPEHVFAVAQRAGFEHARMWTDDAGEFGVFVFGAKGLGGAP